MFNWFRRRKYGPYHDVTVIHLCEYPSGREQGIYYVPPEPGRHFKIWAYGVTEHIDHYIDGVRAVGEQPKV